MRLRALIVFLVLPLVATSVIGAGSTATNPPKIEPALAGFYKQKLVWRPCGKSFDCAKARVPLDYAKPSGPTIGLALKRIKRQAGAKRIGTLVFNPGGPGTSGVASMARYGPTVAEHLGAAYDIVGFDPRGVGASKPLDCLTNAEMDAWLSRSGPPTTPAAKKTYVAAITSYANGCLKKTGALAAHVSTVEVAKDLDILRAVVGDRRLNYLGFSYGTKIGSVYAQLFPKRVGRMVLAGADDPRLKGVDAERSQLRGYEIALRTYIQDCVTSPACPLGTTKNAATQTLRSLIVRLASKPLRTGDPRRPLTGSRAIYAILSALSDPSRRESLASALRSALHDGDGTKLGRIGDTLLGRMNTGKYKRNGNELEASQVIKCLDSASRGGASIANRALPRFRAISPVLGPFWAWNAATCEFWPMKATNPLPNIHPIGAPPILVVGTTRGNAPPYSQAVALAKALRTGVLLTYDGEGHLPYLPAGSTCIDNWVDRYLVTGATPAESNLCSLMGWQLTASNIGLAAQGLSCASLAAYTGSIKPAAGTVITEKRIQTGLDLSNGNITIEKSCIQPTSIGPGAHFVGTGTSASVTIRDSEIDGSKLTAQAVAYSCAFRGIGVLERNYIHDMGSGICFFDTGTTLSGSAVNNYVRGLRAYGDPSGTGSHNEAATVRDFPTNSNPDRTLTIRYNRLVCDSGSDTAALFIQTFAGDINNVTVEGNLLETDAWELPLEALYGHTYGTNMRSVNNRFRPGGYGPAYVTGGPGWAGWSSNYLNDPSKTDNTGTAVPKP